MEWVEGRIFIKDEIFIIENVIIVNMCNILSINSRCFKIINESYFWMLDSIVRMFN